MKILITGGCGFIGTNLVKSVLKEWSSDELEVKVLDNFSTGFKENMVDDSHDEYHEFDVADYFFDNRQNDN